MLVSSLVGLLAASQVLAAPHIQKRNHSHLGKRSSGRVTFFRIADSNPNLACQGYYYSDESFPLVALSTHGDYSDDKCGQWITVNYNGKSVSAQVQDGCETCSPGQIDLSPGAMAVLDPNYEQTGQFNAEWSFGGGGGKQEEEKPTTKETPTPTPTPTPEPKPEPKPEPTTSTPTTTWTPETSSSSSTTPSTSSTSSTPPPSSSSSSSILSSSSSFNVSSTSSALNATITGNATASLNVTANISASASASHNVTSPLSSGTDHIVQGTGEVESGNLSGVSNIVAVLGRIVALGAGGI